jgi:FkbM family methyltransferase
VLLAMPTAASGCAWTLEVAKQSNCPAGAWRDRVLPLLGRSRMHAMIIGANKGYNANEFLTAFQEGWNVSNQLWASALQQQVRVDRKIGRYLCGICLACRATPMRNVVGTARVSIVAVELTRSNVRLLETLFARFHVPGQVLHAAAGSTAWGTAYASSVQPGEETARLTDPISGEPTPEVTVDQLMERFGVATLDSLQIDTEGNDAAVLQGARQTLSQLRARVVEFEYHGIGAWRTIPLNATVQQLLEDFGYRCFWQGNSGALAPFIRGCDYEFRKWSNLVCPAAPTPEQPQSLSSPNP